jgi:hypothetical protein
MGFEQRQRLRRGAKPTVAAAAEDHQFRLVVQQPQSHQRRECLAGDLCQFRASPRLGRRRPQFDIAEPAKSLDFDEAPTVVDHPGRRRAHTREASAYARWPVGLRRTFYAVLGMVLSRSAVLAGWQRRQGVEMGLVQSDVGRGGVGGNLHFSFGADDRRGDRRAG